MKGAHLLIPMPEPGFQSYPDIRLVAAPAEVLRQLRADLTALLPFVEKQLGLESRWTGQVFVFQSRNVDGVKASSCAIGIRDEVLDSPTLLINQLHEMIHSASVGLTENEIILAPGLEEGVTELLARSLLPDVAEELGRTADAGSEVYAEYNGHLRSIYELARVTELEGSLELLRVPLAERSWHVVRMIHRAHPERGMAWAYEGSRRLTELL